MKKAFILFATVALAVATAASNVYRVTLAQAAWVGGNQLKAGDYRVEIEGNKAIFKMGKSVIEAPAKVETAEHKFDTTQVQIENANSKPRISEIGVGGTNTKIVFSNNGSAVE